MVKTGEIRDAELNDVISFEIQSIISGYNRKLSFLKDFSEISNNFEARTRVIRGAESNSLGQVRTRCKSGPSITSSEARV